MTPNGTRGDESTYLRSADPVGYWLMIALKAAFVVGIVAVSLSGLLGLWNWN